MGRHKKYKKISTFPKIPRKSDSDKDYTEITADSESGCTSSPGAPKGGRVHWVLWCLRSDVWAKYRVLYRYPDHNYIIYRKSRKQFWHDFDVFVVVRTSQKCFKVTYVDLLTVTFTLKSFSSPTDCAIWINKQAKLADKIREDTELIEQLDHDPEICYNIYRNSNWRRCKEKKHPKKPES